MRSLLKWLLLLSGMMLCILSVVYAQTYSHILCNDPHFTCYTVKHGDSMNRLFSDANELNLVRKVNRINTAIYPGMRLAIPKHLSSSNLMDYSPFDKQINPPGSKIIVVSLKKLAWGAYDANGQLVRWGPASGGRGYCADQHRACHTVVGHFSIYRKEGAHCFSTKFPVSKGGAPMPYCMFFHNGFALHGSYEVPGYNDSHGCVRMFIDDAQWLNQNFTTGSKVDVLISPP